MVEFEVIVVEFLPDELERRARLERDRKRKWTQNNRPWLANRARRRYRRSNYRTCPGTPEDPVCVIELTSTRCVRCDYHAHKWAKALRRAAYHAKKESADA